MRLRLVVFAVLAALLVPSAVFAADPGDANDDFNLRVNGDFTLPAGQSLDTLLVINGDAAIDGTVRETLIVINGTARISGEVQGDTIVVSGDANLAASARVHDLTLIRSDLVQAPGAVVDGDISRTSVLVSRGWAIAFGILLWVGWTVLVLIAGLTWARFGGRQLTETVTLMAERPGPTILTGVVSSFLFPLAAILALITVVGIPAGLATLLVVIPAIVLLGHVVTGTWIGSMILSGSPIAQRTRPIAPALLGLAVLQVVALIPGVGAGVTLVSGLWGGGAVVYRIVKGAPAPTPPPSEATVAEV